LVVAAAWLAAIVSSASAALLLDLLPVWTSAAIAFYHQRFAIRLFITSSLLPQLQILQEGTALGTPEYHILYITSNHYE